MYPSSLDIALLCHPIRNRKDREVSQQCASSGEARRHCNQLCLAEVGATEGVEACASETDRPVCCSHKHFTWALNITLCEDTDTGLQFYVYQLPAPPRPLAYCMVEFRASPPGPVSDPDPGVWGSQSATSAPGAATTASTMAPETPGAPASGSRPGSAENPSESYFFAPNLIDKCSKNHSIFFFLFAKIQPECQFHKRSFSFTLQWQKLSSCCEFCDLWHENLDMSFFLRCGCGWLHV